MRVQQGHSMLQTIGIRGTDSGNGVTHLAIMLGNYLTAKLHKNTAILEMNHTNSFLELKESYVDNIKKNQGLNYFEISRVTYYYNIQSDKVGEIYSKEHEYIIIDMGNDNLKQINEFLKCNIKIVIGNLNPWKNKKFIHIIENYIACDNLEKVKYLVQFGLHDDVHQIENDYKICIYATPFEPDPFLIHGCNFEFFENLLH
ncbi:MAG: hypothetical protein ACERKZ_09925 [Lachnotalea sp.]